MAFLAQKWDKDNNARIVLVTVKPASVLCLSYSSCLLQHTTSQSVFLTALKDGDLAHLSYLHLLKIQTDYEYLHIMILKKFINCFKKSTI